MCKSLDLILRSPSDGLETPLRDEDTLIRRRHAKPHSPLETEVKPRSRQAGRRRRRA
jgi:hypothetical protein